MHIRKYIVFFILFCVVSFNVFADFQSNDTSQLVKSLSVSVCGVKPGDVFQPKACIGHQWTPQWTTYTADQVRLYCYTNKECRVEAIDNRTNKVATVGSVSLYATCPLGQELNSDTSKCEEPPPSCADTAGDILENQSWPQKIYGSSPNVCASGCLWQATGVIPCINGTCIGDMMQTEQECSMDGIEPGSTPPEGCVQDPAAPNTNPYLCPKDLDGDGQPDQGADLDPLADCGFGEDDKFTCTGGSYDKTPEPDPEPEQPLPDHKPTDPTDPIPDPSPLPDESTNTPFPDPVDPKPEVPNPTPDPDGDSDVVIAVTNMNKDINKALYDLNVDINKSNASIQSELDRLNGNTRENSQAIKDFHQASLDIAENNKALILQANADITTAVNKNTNAVNALKGQVTSIGESLDSIINTDTSGAGVSGTCIATDSCTGFYESNYPDGVSGIFENHFDSLSVKVSDTVNGLFELDLSNASKPKFGIPVPFYGWFYFSDYINLDWVFAFVRICMMVSTAFLCRKLLFGG